MNYKYILGLIPLACLGINTAFAESACLSYGKEAKLTGYVEVRTFYGPPGFGENPKTDSRSVQNILFLDEPICSEAAKDREDEKNEIEVTLRTDGSSDFLNALAGKHVSVIGKLEHSEVGNDNTNLILSSVKMSESDAEYQTRIERKPILDAIRPEASKQAGQPVRIKIERLNVSNGSAILIGNIVAEEGKTLDWSLAKNCEADLDKMLWVVLNKTGEKWNVKEMTICASEPPYWYLKDDQLTMPCEVYKGMDSMQEGSQLEDLGQRCEALKEKPQKKTESTKNSDAPLALDNNQKLEMLTQFQQFQQALKSDNVSAVKSFFVFPLTWNISFWPKNEGNPPEKITEEVFDKYSLQILNELKPLSLIHVDLHTMAITEYRKSGLSKEEQRRMYYPADGDDENLYYYKENNVKHFVNGTCDDVTNAEFFDNKIIASIGSEPNKQLPGMSELCDHAEVFDFAIINHKLRLISSSFAG